MRTTAFVITVLVGLATVGVAYAGCLDPRVHPNAAVAVMLMPAMAPLLILILVADLLWWRRAAIVAALCLLVSLPSILDTYPVNFGGGKADDSADSLQWTLLTYNVMNFSDLTGEYPGGQSPTLDYIIRADADVVCLQELEYFCALPQFHVTQAQVDSITARYPHIIISNGSQCLMSKFPVEPINVSLGPDTAGKGMIAAYSLNIHGHRVALFNVHLHSFELSDSDKALYTRMTRLNGGDSSFEQMRYEVLPKIKYAAAAHADQADNLSRLIKKYGGHDVVVCGDFNDVPGCYALRRLEDEGLHQVYPETGLGYMRTYNRNRFYFRIDHVLYRGDLKPLDMTRGDLMSSDHFPITATFTFTTPAR